MPSSACSQRNSARAHGFDNERWTRAWVQTVIHRQLRLTLSVATVWRLLKRQGWSWQAPARRALDLDEHAVELGKKEVWPRASLQRVGLDRLRGRSRVLHDVAPRPHLGPARTHPRHPGERPLPQSELVRGPVVLQTLRGRTSHPPAPQPSPAYGRPKKLLLTRTTALTTIRVPPYAPDLNPVEAWSLVHRAIANATFGTPDDRPQTPP
ncbi:winged helix-turn-helix domain-containing protein [Streptomyces sp. NPDC051546]|uniref:winged helix-turn-helix domain-containing protein n=1 Tax=Streptomyces sp. NPDC051546 TaxID=3365655 RepID=UPI0037ADA924